MKIRHRLCKWDNFFSFCSSPECRHHEKHVYQNTEELLLAVQGQFPKYRLNSFLKLFIWFPEWPRWLWGVLLASWWDFWNRFLGKSCRCSKHRDNRSGEGQSEYGWESGLRRFWIECRTQRASNIKRRFSVGVRKIRAKWTWIIS